MRLSLLFPHLRPFPRFTIRMAFAIAAVFLLLVPMTAEARDDSTRIHPDRLHYGPLRFHPPHAERIVLDNGLVLFFLEDRELPLINLTMSVRTGTMHDPEGKEGLAELTSRVMRTGGTGKMNGRAVDEALEFVAAQIEPSVSMDVATWTLGVTKQDIDETLDILSQIIKDPVFEEDRLRLAQSLKIEEIRRLSDDPQKLAFREFNRLLYEGNARGRLPSISSIRQITREDLIRFHQAFYGPQQVMVALSGDLSKAEAIEKMTRYFGAWQQRCRVVSVPAPVSQHPSPVRYLMKDTPQSIVIAGHFVPSKRHKDYYALEVLDFLVGSGGFRSRIFQEIRTNRGLAYSAGSFYRARADYGVFGAYAMTKTDSAPLALSLIKSILQASRLEAPSVRELERAKKAIVNSFIFEYQSFQKIAVQQMMTVYNALPDSFLATYCDRIEKLTASDIQAAGRDYLRPDDMVILILGGEDGYRQMKQVYPSIEMGKVRDD